MKKYSVLGLTLVAVSALTAAFLPSKSASKPYVSNGTIRADGTAQYTCSDSFQTSTPSCFISSGVSPVTTSTGGIEATNAAGSTPGTTASGDAAHTVA